MINWLMGGVYSTEHKQPDIVKSSAYCNMYTFEKNYFLLKKIWINWTDAMETDPKEYPNYSHVFTGLKLNGVPNPIQSAWPKLTQVILQF